MDRYLLFIFLFFFLEQGSSQEVGSLSGQVKNVKNELPVSGVKIDFYRDSILLDSIITDINGQFHISNLKIGLISLFVQKSGYHRKHINNLVIQKNQIGRFQFYLEEGDSVVKTNHYASGGEKNNTDLNKSLQAAQSDQLNLNDIQLAACVIMCYKVPLISRDATNLATITRDDIKNLPMRHPISIASTVGGVLTNEQNEIISIRGSRSENVTYFVDGVKVQNFHAVHRSSLKQVQVITGGLPANYGDVTGGVIAVNTMSYSDHSQYSYENYNPLPIESKNYSPEKIEEHFFHPKFETESYEIIYENEFLNPTSEPLSTFSIDVDKASYSNIRRILFQGERPKPDAVRIEELINYFTYDYEAPDSNRGPLAIHTEFGICPWNKSHQLLKIGMKGKELDIGKKPSSNLVFLIDVSGSMTAENKLPLLKQALSHLVENLDKEDRIAIVVYAGVSGLVLESTACSNQSKILKAINNLVPGGSTNGAAGIELAYKIAEEEFIEGGNNRVILATDGDFNVGTSSNGDLENLITLKRESGIFLTTLGFGMGNYKDDKMELLADKGNGNYFYIDNFNEARKALGKELFGTLYTIAKDVKLQLEFNPKKVKNYRLIGYENRLLAAQDFNNDLKDAGELGAGHTVTALYEIIPFKSEEEIIEAYVDPLRYQKIKTTTKANSDELVQIKCRYKLPDQDTSTLLVYNVPFEFSSNSADFNFSAAVAAYGMKLRDSKFVSNFSWDRLYRTAEQNMGKDKDGYRIEFLKLILEAEKLTTKKSN
ncbi:MAG: von Willebrand factor type A domain-containing protein [Crocinitomicaceae bacterium]